MAFPSQQRHDEAELTVRRACANVDERMPGRKQSSIQMLHRRFMAVVEAWRHQQEHEIRDELRQLSEEALLLSRSEPLVPR